METLVERIQKSLEIWRSAGAPLIHLGPGENCEDLESASRHSESPLETGGSNPDGLERHLEIVKQWLVSKRIKV